jgi:dolichyl-phosphate-mannose-protein mannosyltransferase
VFDEYHFGRFVNQYCARTYLFDIHPPLGKLTLLAVGKLFGYDHTVCAYNAIQDVYAPTCKYWVLRATAAAFGSLTAPLMYLAVRGFDGGIWAGVLCASFFIFDNLNLIESRLVLIDSQLIFWCAMSLVVAQRWWRRWREDFRAREEWARLGGSGEGEQVDKEAFLQGAAAAGAPAALVHCAQRMLGATERNLWCLAVGVVTSSAISIKWTGLATPGMIGMESFFGFFFQRKRPVPLVDLLKILAVAAVLYYTWFVIHFAILTKSGDGDAFMRVEFQRTLFNNTNYDPLAKHPGYLTTFIQLNQEMLAANARIELRHNWESVWWEWPLNLRGLLYYSKDMPGAINRTKVRACRCPALPWRPSLLRLAAHTHTRARARSPPSFLCRSLCTSWATLQ